MTSTPNNNQNLSIDESMADFLTSELKHHEHTIRDVSRWLNRSYSYSYSRLRGDDSFTLNDLETLSKNLGYANIYALIRAQEIYAHKYN